METNRADVNDCWNDIGVLRRIRELGIGLGLKSRACAHRWHGDRTNYLFTLFEHVLARRSLFA